MQLLTRLHAAAPPAAPQRGDLALQNADGLREAIANTSVPWHTGPSGERAPGHAGPPRRRSEGADRDLRRAGVLTAYTEATGTLSDDDALALFRMWYDLSEIAGYLGLFRSPHDDTEDTAESGCSPSPPVGAVARLPAWLRRG